MLPYIAYMDPMGYTQAYHVSPLTYYWAWMQIMDLPSMNQPTKMGKTTSITGWWYTYPLKNMLVSWDYYSQYMESHKIPWFQSPPTR